MSEFLKNKKLAASLSVTSNTALIIFKLIAGFICGSISIISEAIHSCSDLLAAIITFFSVSKSEQPADKEHQFGHGKYEDLSGLIEGCLIVLAALYIIYESFKKLIFGAETLVQEHVAIAVMLFSVIINILVSTYLFMVAKKTDSIALYADAEHLRTDIYSSLAVFLGLLVIKFSGLYILDPIIALFVATIIIRSGVKICKRSSDNLLDASLPDYDIEQIKNVIAQYKDIVDIKEIKTSN